MLQSSISSIPHLSKSLTINNLLNPREIIIQVRPHLSQSSLSSGSCSSSRYFRIGAFLSLYSEPLILVILTVGTHDGRSAESVHISRFPLPKQMLALLDVNWGIFASWYLLYLNLIECLFNSFQSFEVSPYLGLFYNEFPS